MIRYSSSVACLPAGITHLYILNFIQQLKSKKQKCLNSEFHFWIVWCSPRVRPACRQQGATTAP